MSTPLVHSIAEACEATNTGRTALYEAIKSGALRAVKRGRRTLILDEDLRRWVQSLPPITVKQSSSKCSADGHKDGDNGAGYQAVHVRRDPDGHSSQPRRPAS
jgi:excisionase family DNA binding protein